MSNTRDTGFLRNAIQVTDQGVTFVSGSTTLMSISSSGAVTTTGVISGSNALSASFSLNSALLNGIGSVGFATTGALLEVSSSQQQISSSQQQISASLLNVVANYATTGSNSFRANQSITGSLVVSSTITAQTLVVQTVTSSIVYSSGSNLFGSALGDRQTFTGSVNITGSLTVNTTGTEFQVNNRGVVMGNLLTDNHSITGSVNITGSLALAGNDITITNKADGPMIILQNINSSSYSQIQFKGDTKDAYIFKGNSTYGSYGGTNALNFYTDSVSNGFAWHPMPNTNAMVLSQAGYLGLNVGVSPTNLLHLAGASATPSLRLGSISVGYHWDIGRENATTGDFIFNYTANGTFAGTFARITTGGLFGIGVTASGTYGKLSVAGGIRTIDDNNSKLELGRYSSANPYSYLKIGTNATSLNITNAADSADLFYFTNSGRFGIGISPTTVLDIVGGNSGNALTVMQNTATAGYSGIDFYRQGGVHAGSVWCANDTAGATNNRNALTLAARQGGEKVIIVGGGYDPTVTGGLTITGANTKLEGNNAYHMINSTTGLYSYLFLNNEAGGVGSERTAYFIQNTAGQTSNGVAAGAAYLYFGQTQNMEFVWAGVSKASITNGGVFYSVGGGTSDLRTKQDIEYNFDNGIESILKLQPTKFKFKNSPDKQRRGFIAQDVLETIPDLVLGNGEIEGGTYGLDYDGVIAIAVKAIQELKAENDSLKEILQRNNIN